MFILHIYSILFVATSIDNITHFIIVKLSLFVYGFTVQSVVTVNNKAFKFIYRYVEVFISLSVYVLEANKLFDA